MRFKEFMSESSTYKDLTVDGKDRETELVGSMFISTARLTSLKGCHRIVLGNFYAFDNKLTSLDYIPQHITLGCAIDNNPITSLKGIHKKIEFIGCEFTACFCPIKNGIIDILKIEHAPTYVSIAQQFDEIINKHLKNPNIKERVANATIEFIDNDLEEFI